MGRERDEVSGKPPLVRQSAWAIGVVFATALLGNVCIIVGAALAMPLAGLVGRNPHRIHTNRGT